MLPNKELGFQLKEKDFPSEIIHQHYFWSVQQINVSGVGHIDYRKIYDNASIEYGLKGKVSYMTLKNAFDFDNEGKKIAVCATVIEIEEISYKDKLSGEKKYFCKLKLQQNNDIIELICWSEFYLENKDKITGLKDRIVITTGIIKYNDYVGVNTLNSFKSSVLYTI